MTGLDNDNDKDDDNDEDNDSLADEVIGATTGLETRALGMF
jgi:hypothetical protein